MRIKKIYHKKIYKIQNKNQIRVMNPIIKLQKMSKINKIQMKVYKIKKIKNQILFNNKMKMFQKYLTNLNLYSIFINLIKRINRSKNLKLKKFNLKQKILQTNKNKRNKLK